YNYAVFGGAVGTIFHVELQDASLTRATYYAEYMLVFGVNSTTEREAVIAALTWAWGDLLKALEVDSTPRL
ncbi:MAG: hypothetical protein AAF125_11460, partial [Chloroflexota bacterium]